MVPADSVPRMIAYHVCRWLSTTNAQFSIDRLATSGQVADFHLLAVARATGSVLVTMDKAILTCLAISDRYLAELLP